MGRVAAPYGVRGWFRVQHFTESLDGLADYPHWWVGHDPEFSERPVAECRIHSGALIARLEGIEDRSAAQALQGCDIAVPRELLPKPAADEVYWADLVGLAVVNPAGESLGRVVEMLETGANDVMVVQGEQRQTLIPYVDAVVLKVDLAAGLVTVDWGLDY